MHKISLSHTRWKCQCPHCVYLQISAEGTAWTGEARCEENHLNTRQASNLPLTGALSNQHFKWLLTESEEWGDLVGNK